MENERYGFDLLTLTWRSSTCCCCCCLGLTEGFEDGEEVYQGSLIEDGKLKKKRSCFMTTVAGYRDEDVSMPMAEFPAAEKDCGDKGSYLGEQPEE